jgi:NAD(P)-dependent dehydrogenase (short-subunit alcohol dehydrogenase family)
VPIPTSPQLAGHRVLVPGGTGGVGEGVVRRYLAAGAEVVVPTRSQSRADEFRMTLGDDVNDHLHLVVHAYSTFAEAEDLAAQVVKFRGGIDSVVAPIGGWWAGKRLTEITEEDWQSAFLDLATAHIAVLRACLPRMSARGAYTIIVGDSATSPVPGSGLVSMEQSALLMMQQVAEAELNTTRRVFALMLGPVATRSTGHGDITAEQVGSITVAASAATTAPGRIIAVHNNAEVDDALTSLAAS